MMLSRGHLKISKLSVLSGARKIFVRSLSNPTPWSSRYLGLMILCTFAVQRRRLAVSLSRSMFRRRTGDIMCSIMFSSRHASLILWS